MAFQDLQLQGVRGGRATRRHGQTQGGPCGHKWLVLSSADGFGNDGCIESPIEDGDVVSGRICGQAAQRGRVSCDQGTGQQAQTEPFLQLFPVPSCNRDHLWIWGWSWPYLGIHRDRLKSGCLRVMEGASGGCRERRWVCTSSLTIQAEMWESPAYLSVKGKTIWDPDVKEGKL